jgi:hypothetical protein
MSPSKMARVGKIKVQAVMCGPDPVEVEVTRDTSAGFVIHR